MNRFELNENKNDNGPLILIFTEGTIIGPKKWIDFFNLKKYAPIKNCISKINKWEKQGFQVVYLTSRKDYSSALEIKNILTQFKFPGSYLYYRTDKEKYKDVVEKLKPVILIEDNCRSIGGKWQMAITFVDHKIKEKIKSIVVREFHGIDELPDNLIDY